MKKEILFVLFLFFASSCFAQQIELQQDKYAPYETIIGQIDDVLSEVASSDIQIYEGRREVFFEKGVLINNKTIYFYVIPTKEGNFSIKINNVLYNSSGLITSFNLEKNIQVTTLNESVGFGLRPGVYEGQNPEFIVANLKPLTQNISINGSIMTLKSLESKKVILNVPDGFSIYSVGNYSVPIIKFSLTENNITTATNNTSKFEEYDKCMQIYSEQPIVVEINKPKNFSIFIVNNCSTNISGLNLKSSESGITFYTNNFSIEKNNNTSVIFEIVLSKLGKSMLNFTGVKNNLPLFFNEINVYSFENNTGIEVITTNKTTSFRSCSSERGIFCKEGESCNAENSSFYFYDFDKRDVCCLAECIDPNAHQTNWANIVVALVGMSLVIYVIYLLITRSKKLKSPKIEDKFKETERKYEQKFTNSKKNK